MNYDDQRNAITQAMMNINAPPPALQAPQLQRPYAPRPMTAQMTPQMQQLPQSPAAPQMPSMGGGDFMRRPQMPIGAPDASGAPPVAPPGAPMSLAPPDMSQQPMMPTDVPQYQ